MHDIKGGTRDDCCIRRSRHGRNRKALFITVSYTVPFPSFHYLTTSIVTVLPDCMMMTEAYLKAPSSGIFRLIPRFASDVGEK